MVMPGSFPASLCQLTVALGKHDLLTPMQLVLWRHIAYGAVKSLGVVVFHELIHYALGILERQRCARPDALRLDRLVPTFDLAIALGVERCCPDMRHATQTKEFLETLGHKLRGIVRDSPRCGIRELLPRSLQNHLDVCFCHRLSYLPVGHVTAIPVQNTAQVVERAANVELGHISAPVFVGRLWLVESSPLHCPAIATISSVVRLR